MRIRGVTSPLKPLVLAAMLTACAAPAPTVDQQAGHPLKGAADAALERFDLSTILKTVDGGSFCQLGGGGINSGSGSGGSSGSSGRRHVSWTVTCPRPGRDRTIYFELADAIEAELGRIATVEGKSAESGDAPDPVSATLDVRGNAYLGTVRILGVNGNANITTFVDVDLAIP